MVKSTTSQDAGKADALLAQDTAALATLVAQASNEHAKAREAALVEFNSLGHAAGKGAGSLTLAAMRFAKLVADGTLDVGKGKAAKGDDAEVTYLAFAAGFNATVAHGADSLATDAKTPISTFRSFGAAAPFHRGADTYFERVLEAHASCAKDERVSAYNALVSANRKLVEASELPEFKGAAPATVLAHVASDEWVMQRCLKKPTAEKSALDLVADAIGKLAKLGDTGEFAGLGEHVVGLRAWLDAWKAGGCKGEAPTVELLKAAA